MMSEFRNNQVQQHTDDKFYFYFRMSPNYIVLKYKFTLSRFFQKTEAQHFCLLPT